jgi:ADP-heptose:LPS heptosyltransferase
MRVCAVFSLLPDPAAFIARVRERYADAAITLYTVNAEAARRAETLDLAGVVYRDWASVLLTAPPELRREQFDRVIVFVSATQPRFYMMQVLQVLLWRGLRFELDEDGAAHGGLRALGMVVATLARYTAPSVALAALLNLWWALLLPPASLLGLCRGRSSANIRGVWRHARAMFTSATPFVTTTVARPLLPLRAAWQVARDLARGPLRTEAPRRLLLMRLDHLGDLIAVTGHLAALKAADPPWQVEMVVGPWGAAVLRDDPRVDRLHVYPSSDALVCRSALPPEAAAQRRAVEAELAGTVFDLVIDPAICYDSTRLSYLPQARRRVVAHLNRWFAHGVADIVHLPAGLSEAERQDGMFAAAGLQLVPPLPSLEFSPATEQAAAAQTTAHNLTDGQWLAIHPGAAWLYRQWSLERFAEVARRAHVAWGWRPVGFFGPDENDLATRFTALTGNIGGVTLTGMPIAVVFALLAKAGAFVGNDSGLMHAAAAGGVPTLGVFGPGDLARWSPRGGCTAAVSLHTACSPCYQNFCTDNRCLIELEVDQVWRALEELLAD